MTIASNSKRLLSRVLGIALCIGAAVWACLAIVERFEQAAGQDSALSLAHFAPATGSIAELFRGR
jgi:hypothetical protein